jgi:hypothetical protein
VPKGDLAGSVGALFGDCTFRLLGALDAQRDFSHAWLAALRQSGTPLHRLDGLSGNIEECYASWMRKHSNTISVPEPLVCEDVLDDLADALCKATLRLIAGWERDQSQGFAQTSKRVEATGYLIDGLLTASEAFGGKGLLIHMVDLLDVPFDALVGPLMDLLRKPHRAKRLAQLLAPPPGRLIQPLLGVPDRARHLIELLVRELRAADETLR